ncbi:MAG: DUF3656 domain-containing U32 family peptidase [Lachnospira sp.]
MKNRIEVLSPAGSYDILTAVISAGADAVYLGGDMFGARAYAGNFNRDELIKAIDYAHLRDVKIYMTVNTLLKEDELDGKLIDYIAPFYEAGLDAAIVQDMGVFKTLKENFPSLSLHASTQMTVTGKYSAGLLEKLGASRIVTARELDLNEIKSIRESCNIEIESFVHGALCYCYSGQCLLSSFNGSRSGNRGRCAQPCRLGYEVIDENGNIINSKNSLYALSPKDMCALSILPKVIEAGVNSLKIEGRMKNVTYASKVTSLYRKYVDMYLEKGAKGYSVLSGDIDDLMDIYNRGAFTTGYYNSSKGKNMMSVARPNHMGTKALRVEKNVGGRVTFLALRQINSQDVFEIDSDNSFSSGRNYKEGETFDVNLPRKYELPKGRILYRTRNNRIASEVLENFVKNEAKIPVCMYMIAKLNQPLALNIQTTDKSGNVITASVTGPIVMEAQNQPADADKVKAQLAKLGNTPFYAEHVETEFAGKVFIPVAHINDIRREAVEKLIQNKLELSGRKFHKEQVNVTVSYKDATTKNEKRKPLKSCMISDLSYIDYIIANNTIKAIYLDFSMFHKKNTNTLQEAVIKAHSSNKEVVGVLPHVLRGRGEKKTRELIELMNFCRVDAFLVRSLEQIGLLGSISKNDGYGGSINIITDANLYCWNKAAIAQFKQLAGLCGLNLLRVTYPYELKFNEIQKIADADIDFELAVYSKIPLMISEQCVRKTYGLCDNSNGSIFLKDRKNCVNEIKSVCGYCYSIMLGRCLDITDNELIDRINPDFVRYDFLYGNASVKDVIDKTYKKESYLGHFNMGVE